MQSLFTISGATTTRPNTRNQVTINMPPQARDAKRTSMKMLGGQTFPGIQSPSGMFGSFSNKKQISQLTKNTTSAYGMSTDVMSTSKVARISAYSRARPVMQMSGYDGYSSQQSVAQAQNLEKVKQSKLITAIKTPYTESGQIDIEAFDKHVEHQIENGVQGLVVGGTTGEGHLMTCKERTSLIQHAVNTWGSKLVIVGNAGSNNTKGQVQAANAGFSAGMHGSLIINPYYGKTSKEGVLYHLMRGLDCGPAIIYNVAGRTGQDIEPEIIDKLAEHPNFIGVKECAGNERIKRHFDQGILSWSGNDDEYHEGVWGGSNCHGVISVTSNVLPGVMRSMTDSRNDELSQQVAPFMSWLFEEPNPIAVSTMMAMSGMCSPVFRAPYVPRTTEDQQRAVELLTGFEDTAIVGENRPVVLEANDFTVHYDWQDGIFGQDETTPKPFDVTSIAETYTQAAPMSPRSQKVRNKELVTMQAKLPTDE